MLTTVVVTAAAAAAAAAQFDEGEECEALDPPRFSFP
jgi:hypothetical protein